VAKSKKSKSTQKKTSGTASETLSKFKMEAAREVDLSLKQEGSRPSDCKKTGDSSGKSAKDARS